VQRSLVHRIRLSGIIDNLDPVTDRPSIVHYSQHRSDVHLATLIGEANHNGGGIVVPVRVLDQCRGGPRPHGSSAHKGVYLRRDRKYPRYSEPHGDHRPNQAPQAAGAR
jgi:hypothetical protein